jgi:hypothetical protein
MSTGASAGINAFSKFAGDILCLDIFQNFDCTLKDFVI